MDKTYWREFYSRHKIGVEPSLFAKFMYENYLLPIGQGFSVADFNTDFTNKNIRFPQEIQSLESHVPSLLELGCGMGRWSLFLQ